MAKQQRLREGRSSVEGLSARPWPGLASPRLTFTGRLRADKAPDVLVEALALLDASPPAYLVGDGPARQALNQLVRSTFGASAGGRSGSIGGNDVSGSFAS
jgi:hypothetical protein